MEKKFKVYGIEWDTDGEQNPGLPKEMEVTVTDNDVEDLNDEEEVEEYLSDYITDETGYCHEGFEYKEI